jgi:hypothetical protein
MHVTVISHRYRWLSKRDRTSYHILKLVRPIEETVLSMKMEMTELGHCDLAR